ncbi:hypothetical protein PDIG_33770 [Penicillium digitatum PHI26]|uniref:Uncharacterized protein n=1 Tax=Penicillium digitatum (strain PHI26 / CECT 20796) TaxID=1170229 RepID=K9GLZ4_PEND2|nr:hypothetical protein PDIG_33770 [Penicillium digitatum PHI26]
MGFTSTLSRCMRKHRLSRRPSTTSTKLHDEDANDLIQTASKTSSTRASVDSTSTMVQHSFHEPVQPCESPANRMQIRPDHAHMRILFDGNATPTHPTNRATGAQTRPAYPILTLDCRSPIEAPRRVLQAPVEIGREERMDQVEDEGTCSGKGVSGVSPARMAQTGVLPPEKCVSEKKFTKSLAALLKKHCGLNIPRSSISINTSRGQPSPKWLDLSEMTEEDGFMDKKSEKWVEAHEKRIGVLGVGFGRLG